MAVSFAKDIRPLFTDIDIDHMSFFCDLASHSNVKVNATDIVNRLNATGKSQMPPTSAGGPWEPDKVALFQTWISDGVSALAQLIPALMRLRFSCALIPDLEGFWGRVRLRKLTRESIETCSAFICLTVDQTEREGAMLPLKSGSESSNRPTPAAITLGCANMRKLAVIPTIVVGLTVLLPLLMLILIAGAPGLALAQNVVYHPIPQGFDFPADSAVLLKLRDNGDVSGMRKHAWMLFAGLTQPTETGEATWETWYTADQTFRAGAGLQGEHPLMRKFRNPRQFMTPGPHPQAIGASLLSFTLFNADVRKHVRTNNYNSSAHLTELNNAFDPSTPIADRHITDFPNTAVSLKTVWWIVKKNGLTATPVWDPELNPQIAQGNDYPTWKRVVAVDPSRDEIPAGETATVNLLGHSFAGSSVVPLAHFYHFQISQREIDSVRASSAPNAQDAEIGDYAVLIAMHCTTKEIPQWVWATFWWHDKPDVGRFAADRPDAVTGVWRNYLMNTTYSMDQPKEADGSPPICFNPWLEAHFRNGVKSNCMACHQKAVWPTNGNFLPITRGSLKPDDPIFVNKMTLDFLWSVALESQ